MNFNYKAEDTLTLSPAQRLHIYMAHSFGAERLHHFDFDEINVYNLQRPNQLGTGGPSREFQEQHQDVNLIWNTEGI